MRASDISASAHLFMPMVSVSMAVCAVKLQKRAFNGKSYLYCEPDNTPRNHTEVKMCRLFVFRLKWAGKSVLVKSGCRWAVGVFPFGGKRSNMKTTVTQKLTVPQTNKKKNHTHKHTHTLTCVQVLPPFTVLLKISWTVSMRGDEMLARLRLVLGTERPLTYDKKKHTLRRSSLGGQRVLRRAASSSYSTVVSRRQRTVTQSVQSVHLLPVR